MAKCLNRLPVGGSCRRTLTISNGAFWFWCICGPVNPYLLHSLNSFLHRPGAWQCCWYSCFLFVRLIVCLSTCLSALLPLLVSLPLGLFLTHILQLPSLAWLLLLAQCGHQSHWHLVFIARHWTCALLDFALNPICSSCVNQYQIILISPFAHSYCVALLIPLLSTQYLGS